MKRKLIIAAVVLMAGLTAVPFAYAQVGRMHHAGGAGFPFLAHVGHLKRQLDLSDDQVTQIKGIFKDFRAQNAPYRDQLHGGMKAVAQALINNPNDIAGAQALLDQQSAAEKAMKSNALVAASKALNVLTADQRAKLGQIMSEHMAERTR